MKIDDIIYFIITILPGSIVSVLGVLSIWNIVNLPYSDGNIIILILLGYNIILTGIIFNHFRIKRYVYTE